MDKIKGFFKLIRWFHELVAILPFLVLYIVIIYYSQKIGIDCQLSGWNFVLICFCFQLLIATGCVMNDIVDRHIDKINKPKTHVIDRIISLKNAKIIFGVLTGMVLILSIYISVFVFWEWVYISLFIYISSLVYDFYLKRSPLLGNILMALLTASIPLVLFFYAEECIKAIQNEKIYVLIYLYAAFPFLIIIPRELSLDISDMGGDKACGCYTLPIMIGIKKSKRVVASFLFLIIIFSVPVSFKYSYLTIAFVIVDVLLLYYIFRLHFTEKRIDYIRIGRFLWFIMIFGLVLFTLVTLL